MKSLSNSIWILLTTAAWLSAGTATSAELISRFTRVGTCRAVASSTEPDWVLKRCFGFRGQPVWIAYTGGTKSHVGFGPQKNVSGIFATTGVENALLEWRETLIGKTYEPFAVITRMNRPFHNPKESFLVVYRLQRDGTSCIVGYADSNTKARAVADASLDVYGCEDQPTIP
jgi:hypothetical protein